MCMPAGWRFLICRDFEYDSRQSFNRHTPRRRGIQYAAPHDYRSRFLRLLDRPPSRTMTTEFKFEAVDTLKVRDAKDVEEVVRAAIAGEQPLEIIGHGTKRAIGHPMATNAVLDLSALNAVSAYEPNELIITVQSGAPLADVQSLIDSKNQQFAFEPMDTSVLLGVSGNGTIGGMIGVGAGRSAPHQGRRRARSSARRACGVGLRRQFQDRRQGGEERHRLRSLQTAGGVVGHAGRDDGSDAEGDAEARERADAGARRARRCHREPGDDRGARFALRRVRRGASAGFGVRFLNRRAGAPRGWGTGG